MYKIGFYTESGHFAESNQSFGTYGEALGACQDMAAGMGRDYQDFWIWNDDPNDWDPAHFMEEK